MERKAAVTRQSGVRGLVERIGEERVRAILRRFYRRLREDALVGFFFAGRDLDDIADGQLAFLQRATGAAPHRPPRHPREAHRDLPPILRGHFDRRLLVLREVLEAEGVQAEDVEVWLRLEQSLRALIQSREPRPARKA